MNKENIYVYVNIYLVLVATTCVGWAIGHVALFTVALTVTLSWLLMPLFFMILATDFSCYKNSSDNKNSGI